MWHKAGDRHKAGTFSQLEILLLHVGWLWCPGRFSRRWDTWRQLSHTLKIFEHIRNITLTLHKESLICIICRDVCVWKKSHTYTHARTTSKPFSHDILYMYKSQVCTSDRVCIVTSIYTCDSFMLNPSFTTSSKMRVMLIIVWLLLKALQTPWSRFNQHLWRTSRALVGFGDLL